MRLLTLLLGKKKSGIGWSLRKFILMKVAAYIASRVLFRNDSEYRGKRPGAGSKRRLL